jgi:1-acyl-sn-glycerol-3-phosphate acyltransferase
VIYDISRALLRILVVLAWRWKVAGAGNLPAKGGVIVASNHQSFLDVLLVGTALRRRTRFLARRTLWDNPVLGAWMTAVGALPVGRDRPAKAEMQAVLDALARGEVVTLFPEGTRSPDGEIREMRGGVAMLARRSGVPVLPVLLQGARETWPRGRSLPGRGRVRVRFGRAVKYGGTWEDDEVAADIRRRLLALRDGPATPPPIPTEVVADGAPRGGEGSA